MSEQLRPVAVIGGTPLDTALGVAFLQQQASPPEIFAYPVADSPLEEQLFQISSTESKTERLTAIFAEAEQKGIRDFFIYCNSLSSAFDFERFADARNVRVYTPLQVYKTLAGSYRTVAIMTANGQSAAGIERVFYRENPEVALLLVSLLPLVNAIERKEGPSDILHRFRLPALLSYFEQNGAECIVLGCTHFPYLKPFLSAYTHLPLIDPAEAMYHLLCTAKN